MITNDLIWLLGPIGFLAAYLAGELACSLRTADDYEMENRLGSPILRSPRVIFLYLRVVPSKIRAYSQPIGGLQMSRWLKAMSGASLLKGDPFGF